jgi:hypothetical protein
VGLKAGICEYNISRDTAWIIILWSSSKTPFKLEHLVYLWVSTFANPIDLGAGVGSIYEILRLSPDLSF